MSLVSIRQLLDEAAKGGIMEAAREAMKKILAQRMKEFGQAGHACDYRPLSLAEMAKRYASETVPV